MKELKFVYANSETDDETAGFMFIALSSDGSALIRAATPDEIQTATRISFYDSIRLCHGSTEDRLSFIYEK